MNIILALLLFICLEAATGNFPEDVVTVRTCCENPLTQNNVTWCDGMYSQKDHVQFKYGNLECQEVMSVSFSPGSVWEGSTNGFYADYFLQYEDRFYSPKDYCLKSMKEDKIEVDICTPQCETEKLCLPKCCNLWDDVSFRNNTAICVASLEGKVWHPMISDDNDFSSEVQMDPSKIQYFIRDPSSSNECTIVRLIKYLHFDFKILSSGQVAWTSSDVLDWYRVPTGRFCVDRETSDNGGEIEVLIGCLEDFIPKINDSLTLVDTINFILTQISLGFLALTLIIYLLLSGHQNVHSWTQFSYFFALWSNLFIASIIYFQTYEDQNLVVAKEGAGQPRGVVCFTASVMSTFFHNATLTTMVALAIDIYKMFRQLLSNGEQVVSKREFIQTQVIAWGIAVIMVSVGLGLHVSNGSMGAPPYGYANCKAKFWLADEVLEAVCHLITVVLFLITLVRVGIVQMKGKEELSKINAQMNYHRALALLFKLLAIMGMTWASILLSFLFVKSTVHAVKWFFTLMEFAISLQGFVIFLMFAFNRKTLDSLGQNYSIIRKLSSASSTTSEQNRKRVSIDPIDQRCKELEEGISS